MKKGEFFDCRTEATLERDRTLEPSSEQLQSDVDKFLANGGKIETCNNLGHPIKAISKQAKIKEIAIDWLGGHFPHNIAVMKAKNLGVNFNLVTAERNRIKARRAK